jgi:hypothetical protein
MRNLREKQRENTISRQTMVRHKGQNDITLRLHIWMVNLVIRTTVCQTFSPMRVWTLCHSRPNAPYRKAKIEEK